MTVMMPTPTGGLNTHSQNLLVSALLNLKLVQPPPPAEDETTWSGASLQADCKQRPWQTVLTTLNPVGNEAYYQPPPRSALGKRGHGDVSGAVYGDVAPCLQALRASGLKVGCHLLCDRSGVNLSKQDGSLPLHTDAGGLAHQRQL